MCKNETLWKKYKFSILYETQKYKFCPIWNVPMFVYIRALISV